MAYMAVNQYRILVQNNKREKMEKFNKVESESKNSSKKSSEFES